MTDYISREYVLKCMEDSRKNAGISEESASKVRKWLYKAPAADVRPVVRGKWKRVIDFTGVEAFGYKETTLVGYGCNVCGYEVDVSEGDYNFCPNCGADMRSTDCTKTATADEEREVLNVRAWLNCGADMREES